MSRILPDLIDALMTFEFTDRPENVVDGPPQNLVSGDYLLIGVDSQDAVTGPRPAGQSSATWAGPNLDVDETGSLTCVIWVASPDGTFKGARDAAYAVHSGLQAAIAGLNTGTPNILAIAGLWELHVTGADELNQGWTDAGAEAAIRFQITYQARV